MFGSFLKSEFPEMVMKRLFMDLLKNQISDRQTRSQTPYITAA